MTLVSEVMTPAPIVASPTTTLKDAAAEMDRLNVGSLPVCEKGRLVGTITDRDITVRATSTGMPPGESVVRDAMTCNVRCCVDDATVADAERIMAEVQVRRLPVVDAKGALIGMLALGDLATEHERGVGETLDRVSRPSDPDRGKLDEVSLAPPRLALSLMVSWRMSPRFNRLLTNNPPSPAVACK